MKTQVSTLLTLGVLALVITSCQKDDLATSRDSDYSAVQLRDAEDCSSVSLTYPVTANTAEDFSIQADIACGRVAIQQGYILVDDNQVYHDLTCATTDLLWVSLTDHECYTNDASWTGSFDEPGIYVFRTQHLMNDGNCDGLGGSNQSGNCSFLGTNFCCFTIEVISDCPLCNATETAWSEGDRYNTGQGNWATYTEYTGESTVTLYAGQTYDAGTVHFSDAVNGEVTITITLNDCWAFQNISENVKINGYDTAPSGNPSPGQFDNKFTANSSPYSATVSEANFYGVHVDVLRPVDCE